MTRITVFIKPFRLELVKSAISAGGANGLTVGDVRGVGNSSEASSLFNGEGVSALPIRARIDVVVSDDLVPELLERIQEAAQTGQPDDGKIFLERVVEVVRIRTGERGEVAI
jgi:nitrogen regulatory protein P-II 1